ncbi:MAG: bifunctional 23S rRNA (guanine(2069)-N(7))-methyltransferase RlmK/23S rRNA (guanine(2445)-N(2))-methyltransferase RlmL [Gammaproteobacteria bacterium]|nr:MAG: bifunctional 23S rRNA (guanine(2069)-N(7))-methyltransferase RlmK/23S rRNA (guanine(2445)-N(2))-methyltransferase RlmL [Gammaproteobacteria bacterium]
MLENQTITVTASRETEYLLARELKFLGISEIEHGFGSVSFVGSYEQALQVCMWSRIGVRVLWPLLSYNASSKEEIYQQVQNIDWSEHIDAENSIAIDFTGKNSVIKNTQYGAQLIKDAIADQFMDEFGSRPDVQRNQPDLRINCHVRDNKYSLSIDLSGDSLHYRGYRKSGVTAPLRENLAAAILQRMAWIETAKRGGSLVDPMCGSGTFLIEAAMIAGDIAPGLGREAQSEPYWGFSKWRKHNSQLWGRLVDKAWQRKKAGEEKIPRIIGYDLEQKNVDIARQCVSEAGAGLGLDEHIIIKQQDILQMEKLPVGAQTGLLVFNPPYGERLNTNGDIELLYTRIGAKIKQLFGGWKSAAFIGDPAFAQNFGIKPQKQFKFYNGAIECCLAVFSQREGKVAKDSAHDVAEKCTTSQPKERPKEKSQQVQMLINRINKNLKHLRKWLQKEEISCYRAYNSDLPEYAVAIDVYGENIHIQEYEAPKNIETSKVTERLQDVFAVVEEVFQIGSDKVFYKKRRRQKGKTQYEKQEGRANFFTVEEGGHKFLTNYSDYLDTGLFIDHRIIRSMIQQRAKNKHFLNLFAYTGSATVYAAAGGAKSTTTVDMSNTYLDWARRNMELNGYKNDKHKLLRADCIEWLQSGYKKKFDLIFIDPPTFSNSKKMEDVFDVQRDHVQIIENAANMLSDDGLIIFSNNYRGFKLDKGLEERFKTKNITAQTISKDFERTPKFHQCWLIEKV